MSTNQQRREAAKRKLERQQKRRAEQAQRRKRTTMLVSVVVIVAVVAVIAVLSVNSQGKPAAAQTAAAPAATAPTGPCTFPATPSEPASKPVSAPTDANPPKMGTAIVTVTTNRGVVPLTLDRAEAPCTVENFLSLTKAGFFNNTPCHRLTTADSLKVLQCGDPTGSGSGGPGYTIPDEPPAHLKAGPQGSSIYPAGSIAMANTGAPNSGGSQFFLVYADSMLPPNYTVFGRIAPAGVQVLQKIAAGGEDDSGGPGDGKPKLATTIQSATTAQ